jgi:hypothetical protein
VRLDPHERARFLTDETLAAGISPKDQCWLRSHTEHCAECASYAELTSQIVKGLNSFSFEIDPGMHRRVQDSVATHTQRLGQKCQYFQVRAWRLVFLAAALLIMAIVPFETNIKHKPDQAELERADTLLLERVDASVSREVPEAMELLMPREIR